MCAEGKAELRPRVSARLEEVGRRSVELRAFADLLRRVLEQLESLPERAGRCDSACGSLSGSDLSTARPVDVVIAPGPEAAGQKAERWRSVPGGLLAGR